GEDVAAAVHDYADVLVAADERILEAALVRRSRVLDRLAAERVLVGPADPRKQDLHQHGAALDLRTRELLDLDAARALHHRRANGRHRCLRKGMRTVARIPFGRLAFAGRHIYEPNTSLNASMYACSLPDGPLSVIVNGFSGWL